MSGIDQSEWPEPNLSMTETATWRKTTANEIINHLEGENTPAAIARIADFDAQMQLIYEHINP